MAPFVPPPGFDPKTDSSYHYIPTAWICVTFISLFGSTTLIHIIEAVYFKLWWLIPTAVLAGLGEIVGWSARYWSSFNDGTESTPFLIQISSTIIAPTPFLAAYFIILGRLITRLGPQYSRLSPKRYTAIFCSADVISLLVQATGGALASSSKDPTFGGNIMLAGIAIQLVFMCLFFALATEFFLRLRRNKPFIRPAWNGAIELASKENLVSDGPDGQVESLGYRERPGTSGELLWFVKGATFSCACLFIRAVYRLLELSDGWNGPIISTQWVFNVFDGAMVFLAMFALTLLHPGVLLDMK